MGLQWACVRLACDGFACDWPVIVLVSVPVEVLTSAPVSGPVSLPVSVPASVPARACMGLQWVCMRLACTAPRTRAPSRGHSGQSPTNPPGRH
eukprot:5339622-Alexandrium_andersonii.AAC.1